MSESRIGWLGALVTAAILSASSVSADQLNCDLGGYAAAPGLTAAVEHDTLTVVWDGDNRQSLRMRFVISAGTPTIRELAVRPPPVDGGFSPPTSRRTSA
jgi:hypothetical protein